MLGHGALGGILLAVLVVAGATGAAQHDNQKARERVAAITSER